MQHQRDIVLPIVESNGGKVLRYIGDGTLCTFESAINSVNAAVKIQNALLEDPIMLRIGIHIGDIVSEKGDIYGDGVNVASRLEPLALPGGVCVSETVYDNIKNQSGIDCISMGRRTLKNVKRPMEVYALEGEGLASPSALNKFNLNMKWIAFAAVVTIIVIVGLNIDIGTKDVGAEKDIGNLSIAVLPFANMSSDPETNFSPTA
ncbi:adenylate/guanylate cyclase domain-containing protein [Candidatus Marinimicrobia bacterium MT.SAG.3]|nr:adenylate/guanylate cyclase domain-containing protein [Candidatus Marinimicrobia bacterium MT.SAG.3]